MLALSLTTFGALAGVMCGVLPALSSAAVQPETDVSASQAGAPGGSGLAILTAKALTCADGGDQVINNAIVLVRDGKIEALGPRHSLAIPEGYEVLDVGERWLAPGMVELHCHQGGVDFFRGGAADVNDMVYLTNPGLRVATTARTGEVHQGRAVAGGVTTVLYIPGSGTNIGGQGVVFKFGPDRWEDALVRDPGGMKLAQWGNPESWTVGVGMTVEHWNTRNTIAEGVAYARRWEASEAGDCPQPEKDIRFDIFRDLYSGEIAIATHTQMYQVVLTTITMIARDFQLPVFLDHSTIGGWLTGELCVEYDVPAIVGPRVLDTLSRRMIAWARNGHEGMRGVAAGYQERGLENVGFNTDSPVIAQEELHVQATMGVRYGLRDDQLQALRGLTIVPAMAAHIDSRVGSLEPGKDADILVCTGYPVDPRVASDLVFVNGACVYDAAQDGRIW
ncbi:MAG: imidazolonepropionase-like amidohydrolase [Planctomycetota bacterium]|jgi:imidazolonepropionase-like amidohydrolase